MTLRLCIKSNEAFRLKKYLKAYLVSRNIKTPILSPDFIFSQLAFFKGFNIFVIVIIRESIMCLTK